MPRNLPAADQFEEAVVVAGAGDDCAAGFVCEALHQRRVPSRSVGVVEVAGERRFDREAAGRLSLGVYGLGDDAANEALDPVVLQVGDAPEFDSCVRDTFSFRSKENIMQPVPVSALVLFAFLYTMSSAAAQTPVGALAVDERQGDQYGWAVDYETAAAAQARALSECGSGCRVVLTFARCAAYAADQDADSTAVGWSESYGSAAAAQQAALSECSSRGGTGCIIRGVGL